MKKYGKIFIADDNEETLADLQKLFAEYFQLVHREKNPNLILSYLSRQQYDVYLIKMNYKSGVHNGNEGIYWMNRIFEHHPDAAVVLTGSGASVETAVRAIKEGAADFLERPWTREKMLKSVLSACVPCKKKARPGLKKALDRRSPATLQIVGASDPIQKLLKQVHKVARTDANILITGENGTGKELVARKLHLESYRSDGPFVGVDMGSLTGSLFESELFGHKKGSFTDAAEDRSGRFEAADKGTLFMDEIGNLPVYLQAKLLSVIQLKQVTPIGTNAPIPVDIRLITATNMPLDRMVREGKFREDLLYRLNTITLHVPALRERKSDIRPLFRHFKEKYESRYGKGTLKVDPSVPELLESWYWPGNVRELEHAVEKAVIMCENGTVGRDDFNFRRNGDMVLPGGEECFNLEKNEIQIINRAIESCSGNLPQASRVLGITRKTLYNKISKYGI